MPSYEKFKAILERKNIRPADVAKGTGMTSTVFSDWKKGKSNPKVDKLSRIAAYLNVPLGELLSGGD